MSKACPIPSKPEVRTGINDSIVVGDLALTTRDLKNGQILRRFDEVHPWERRRNREVSGRKDSEGE